ncbi:MAG: oligosaccharide flippase family protein [Dokdonella sp.]|uniref:lipopolysaccharide biosynthesis protein n=1 Tax=Dokdonella sp. TaxID=2291710 RepID=UPI003266127D
MPKLRTNILSNYAGQIWMAVMAIAFLPQYVRILGLESFGLVGLMLALQSISQMFDFGIGGAVNRELSRRSHEPHVLQGMHDLVRTFEWLIWPMSLFIGVAIWTASDIIADQWLHPEHITRAETARSVAIMGAAVALLWPSNFYSNCLSGLEKQPALNLILATFATLRGVGALIILRWVEPTLAAFLWWYVAMGACQSVVTALVVWGRLPKSPQAARFSVTLVQSNCAFATGLFAVNTLALLLSQVDRASLAALRPLADLGSYTLVLSVSAGLGRMVQPMFNAVYPRFSRLIAAKNQTTLSDLYHLSSQCASAVIFSVAFLMIAFSSDILRLWTGDAVLASRLAFSLTLLAAGSALNGLANVPYALQLASGWTRLALCMNVIALLVGTPLCWLAISRYGLDGAASLWLLANAGFFVFGIPIMHRRLLRGELSRWYLRDLAPSLVMALAVVSIARLILPPLPRDAAGLSMLAFAGILTLTAATAAAPEVRAIALSSIKRQIEKFARKSVK